MHGKFLPIIIGALALLSVAMLTLDGGPSALIASVVVSLVLVAVIRHFTDDKTFITSVFCVGLAARIAFGLFVHIYDLRDFFGGDANTYDYLGNALFTRWTDPHAIIDPFTQWQLDHARSGWGMNYLAAAIYTVLGHNILAAQSICAVCGAAIAPVTYFCATKVFDNKRVAELSAVWVALFPAFVVWSGQFLKDGLMVLLLVLAMTMILSLQEKFSFSALAGLLVSVAVVLPLRFYVFYALGAALVASFILGFSTSARSLMRNTIILVVLGIGLTYLGVIRSASSSLTQYGDLTILQNSRRDLAKSAESGFGADIDVSTPEGALSAVPLGFAYLMLAPFPWQVSNFRGAITEPEVLVWWAMIPLMVIGIAWSLRYRFKKAFPILMFTLLLSVAYSIFQGNVGTAYRQRTQLQVFCFMFIAAGWTIRKEKKENSEIFKATRDRRLREHVQQLARDQTA